MKKIVSLVLAIFFIMFIFLSSRKNISVKLIINRDECNGMMNTIYCDVLIEKQNGSNISYSKDYIINDFEILNEKSLFDREQLSLAGGEKIVLSTQPGRYRIKCMTPVEKQNEYLDKKSIWDSNCLEFDLKPASSLVIDIFPDGDEAGYSGGWILKIR